MRIATALIDLAFGLLALAIDAVFSPIGFVGGMALVLVLLLR